MGGGSLHKKDWLKIGAAVALAVAAPYALPALAGAGAAAGAAGAAGAGAAGAGAAGAAGLTAAELGAGAAAAGGSGLAGAGLAGASTGLLGATELGVGAGAGALTDASLGAAGLANAGAIGAGATDASLGAAGAANSGMGLLANGMEAPMSYAANTGLLANGLEAPMNYAMPAAFEQGFPMTEAMVPRSVTALPGDWSAVAGNPLFNKGVGAYQSVADFAGGPTGQAIGKGLKAYQTANQAMGLLAPQSKTMNVSAPPPQQAQPAPIIGSQMAGDIPPPGEYSPYDPMWQAYMKRHPELRGNYGY